VNTESSILNTVIPIISILKEWYFDFRLQEINEASGLSPEDLETTTLIWVKEYLSSNLEELNVGERQRANEIISSEVLKWIIELDEHTKKHPYLLIDSDDNNEIVVFKSELYSLYELLSKNKLEPSRKKVIPAFRELLELTQHEYNSFINTLKNHNCFDNNNKWLRDENTKWFLSFRDALINKGYKEIKKTPMAESFCMTFKYKLNNSLEYKNMARNTADYKLQKEFESIIPSRDSL